MKNYLFSFSSRIKLFALGDSIPPSSARAKCYALAFTERKGELSIADTMTEINHQSIGEALRAASYVVSAGAAKEVNKPKPELYGAIIFEDGSQLNQS